MSEKELRLEGEEKIKGVENETTKIHIGNNLINSSNSILVINSTKTMSKNKLEEISKEISDESSNSLDVYLNKIDKIHQELISSLTEIEKDVLSVANEIIKKKKFEPKFETDRIEKMSPMVEEIYSKCIAKFNIQKGYEKQAIFNALLSLERKKWIITNQRITRDMILKNPIKRKILAFIEKYPGIHARDPRIEQELQITRIPFLKHISSLEAFGFIRSCRIGGTLNFFPADLPNHFDELAVIFQNEIVVKIIQLLFENPNMTLVELANEIGVYHRAIQYHIDNLIKFNVLINIQDNDELPEEITKYDGRRNYYEVNKDLLIQYNSIFKFPPFYNWI